MKYLSVCSGIESASVAWAPLGWQPLAFSEIEAFPRAVLEQRFPGVRLEGDFTLLRDQPWIIDADILVGGTPCQDFSIAGLRAGLAGDRGNLTLEFLRLADAIDALRLAAGRPGVIVVWENVPGVRNHKDNPFGTFLGALVGGDAPLVPGKKQGWTAAGLVAGPRRAAAWRTLDAQFCGLAQRRERVFVVAGPRDGPHPAAILFEPQSVRGNPAPRREKGQAAARPIAGGSPGSGGYRNDADTADGLIADTVRSHPRPGSNSVGNIAYTLRPTSKDAAWRGDGADNLVAGAAVAFKASHFTRGKDGAPGELAPPLSADADKGDQDTLVLAGTLDAASGRGRGAGTNPGLLSIDLQNVAIGGDVAGTLDTSRPSRGGGQAVLAFGHNDRSGPVDVAGALNGHGGPHGRQDFSVETFVAEIAGALPGSDTPAGHGHSGFTTNQAAMAGHLLVPDALGPDDVADPISASEGDTYTHEGGKNFRLHNVVGFSCKDSGQDAGDISPTLRAMNETEGNAGGQVAIAFDTTQITHPENRSNPQPGGPCHPLAAEGHPPAVAFQDADVATTFDWTAGGDGDTSFRGKSRIYPVRKPERAGALQANKVEAVQRGSMVRRLTPTECERLQGFPDGWTLVTYRGKPAKDGPRYRALGNSMAVPVMVRIGRRIAAAVQS